MLCLLLNYHQLPPESVDGENDLKATSITEDLQDTENQTPQDLKVCGHHFVHYICVHTCFSKDSTDYENIANKFAVDSFLL